MPLEPSRLRKATNLARAIGLLVVLSLTSHRASALDHVVLQLKWRHQFQFSGYYAALAQGYYRAAGLDVELREAKPGSDPIREVLTHRADFGVSTSNLLLLRAQGEPVVTLGVIYQHSPFALLSADSSGIRDIHDLADQPIMMEPDAAEILAYFKNEGVDPKTLTLLPHTFDTRDLINGHASAMSAYTSDEPYQLKAAGRSYHLFSPRASGIDFYGDNLFTTESQIAAHPERVKAFLDASLRGWDYAMSHRDEMIDLIHSQYAPDKSLDELRFEADETAKLIHPELIELGYINPGRWQNIANTYADLGMMPHDFPLDGFIYNRNPRRDLRWLVTAGYIIAALALLTGAWTLLTTLANRRLRREVAARVAAEQHARAENAAKTNFLSILAHEVRSPLSGIISSLWLYRKSDIPGDKSEILDIAKTAADHLLHMVDNILDQSKIESGHLHPEFLSVSPHAALREVTELFRSLARSKHLDLTLEISPAIPEQFTTDPVRLRQILSNLLANALKFTEAGGVHVTCTLDQTAVKIAVTDTGPGLTQEQMSRIFLPYRQADTSTTRHHGGTGLGLTISSRLAELLGGGLAVTSTPGHGSTFTLTLPLDGSDSGNPAHPHSGNPAHPRRPA
ncbi:MAG: ABC transporter substrate-binding protein [Verrucomicrobiota bacterium JB025]|nr:ABC transporter substrate-binding protein [Verrucomicrobiota bacterium JB025]